VLLQQEGEGETFWPTAQQEEATEQQDRTDRDGERNTVSWAADETLHILTNQGKILAMEKPFVIQKTRLAGKRLSEMGKREKVTGVSLFDPMHEAWILSPKGVLYRVPKGTVLSGKAFCNSGNPAYLALLEGGMFFQGEPNAGGKPSIVCLADTGRIRRMSTLHLNRIPENGRQLVRLEPGETLVAACMCCEESGILIVTRNGKGLHLEGQDLKAGLTPGDACTRG
jgi:DNA gyrase/topoisomerase IV subunit A